MAKRRASLGQSLTFSAIYGRACFCGLRKASFLPCLLLPSACAHSSFLEPLRARKRPETSPALQVKAASGGLSSLLKEATWAGAKKDQINEGSDTMKRLAHLVRGANGHSDSDVPGSSLLTGFFRAAPSFSTGRGGGAGYSTERLTNAYKRLNPPFFSSFVYSLFFYSLPSGRFCETHPTC